MTKERIPIKFTVEAIIGRPLVSVRTIDDEGNPSAKKNEQQKDISSDLLWQTITMIEISKGVFCCKTAVSFHCVEYRYGVYSAFTAFVDWEPVKIRKMIIPPNFVKISVKDKWGVIEEINQKDEQKKQRKQDLLLKRKMKRANFIDSISQLPNMPTYKQIKINKDRPFSDLVYDSFQSAFVDIHLTPTNPLSLVLEESLVSDGSIRLTFSDNSEPLSKITLSSTRIVGANTSVPNMSTACSNVVAGAPSSPVLETVHPKTTAQSRALCVGYLTKLGHNLPTWKRRYFELSQTTMYYFANANERRPKGWIEVKKISAVQLITIIGKENVPAFQLVTDARTYRMYADNAQDLEKWISIFRSLKIKITTK